MSKISKYIIDNNDTCTLTFQSDDEVTQFKSGRSDRGIIHTVSTSNIIWKINIQGLDDNNNLIYQNEIHGSGLVNFDDQFGLTCSKASAVLTIFNPEVITIVYGFYFNVPFYVLNHDGYSKMTNLQSIGSYGARYYSTSSVLFDIIPNLSSLDWKSPDVNSLDSRFFEKDLTNLTNLVLDFTFQPNIKIENLRKSFNLLTLAIYDTENVIHNHDIFLNFESNFNYSIKNYHITSRYNHMRSTIHPSVAYLSLLESYSHGGKNSGFDLTFPLFNNQDNLTLKTITIGWNTSIYNNHERGDYTYPENIERLLSLQDINNSRFIFGDPDNLFEKFFIMFYSKIYNETDNTKQGFTISSNSIYFQSLTNLSTGFVHPSFRKHTMNTSSNNSFKIPLSKITKFNEINATGFELLAAFES